MRLVRWDPFSDIDTLFNRRLPKAFAGWPRLSLGGESELEWSPSADISETDKEYLIRAELPAVKKEDVKVTIDQGMLTIEGERKQQKEEKNEKFHRVERLHGSFTRSFSLPDNINIDAISCEDRDGVLTVRIPKVEAAQRKPKEIRVQ
jgi:HSP20 family protein